MFPAMPYHSPIGTLLLECDEAGTHLTGVRFSTEEPLPGDAGASPLLTRTARWLDRYFAGKRPDPCELPFAPAGSGFQRIVWKLLLEIPYGETTSYGALAREVALRTGRPRMAAQAVGGAVGRNPIGVIIPCHRVIGSDGSLTGYAWGVEKKRFLLTLESSGIQ